ncbi:hypothetical protein NL676_002690 [Syzygium grande]|nr:hypothetical protein NL676_002690 [Syzygium grande]
MRCTGVAIEQRNGESPGHESKDRRCLSRVGVYRNPTHPHAQFEILLAQLRIYPSTAKAQKKNSVLVLVLVVRSLKKSSNLYMILRPAFFYRSGTRRLRYKAINRVYKNKDMAAAAAHANSKGMYSWWWNSHISPKNSKWLHENLTDMDVKVNQMIKLIEEDADSFARRAEMYYKKRPELMKLVEEFYRAYRALAERYDHATGVLRQAQKTMAEAFPNQVPPMVSDDSPASESDPRTPEMLFAGRSLFHSDDLSKDSGDSASNLPKRNGAFTEEFDSTTGGKSLKQFNDMFGSAEGREYGGVSTSRSRIVVAVEVPKLKLKFKA